LSIGARRIVQSSPEPATTASIRARSAWISPLTRDTTSRVTWRWTNGSAPVDRPADDMTTSRLTPAAWAAAMTLPTPEGQRVILTALVDALSGAVGGRPGTA
jgi:hypothetical protein